jgi:flavodoxin
MKILITYFSQTGNTKKVAEAMAEALNKEAVDLKPIENVDAFNLKSYDLVVLGSGVYASRVHRTLLKLVKKAPSLPQKFVYFYTHSSLELYQKPFKKITKFIEKTGAKIIGQFDCVGENLGIPEEKQLEMLEKLPLEQKEKAVKDKDKIKGHPNQEDLKDSQDFITSLIKTF